MKNLIHYTTERLLVRPIQIQDAGAVFAYRSNKQANQYQGFIPESVEEVDHFIAQKVCHQINVPGTWVQFVVIKKDTGQLIGDIGVHFHAENPWQSEIGCTFHVAHQGKGYATEALKEMLAVLFVELNKEKITASVDPRNFPSIRLMQRLGFKKEMHLEKSYFIHGIWEDELIFVLHKKDWNCMGASPFIEKQ